jgi:hypothetical protein
VEVQASLHFSQERHIIATCEPIINMPGRKTYYAILPVDNYCMIYIILGKTLFSQLLAKHVMEIISCLMDTIQGGEKSTDQTFTQLAELFVSTWLLHVNHFLDASMKKSMLDVEGV